MDDHHNAAVCPHCTDNGRLVMVEAAEVERVDWDEITRIVNSQCDDPDVDLLWVVDIVREEIARALAASPPREKDTDQ